MSAPRISLCLIARDEEAMLPGCLASVAGAVDELVVVDTGSRDGTRDLARRAGARVVEHAWRDFADARNAALAAATGDWVLVLDADERLAAGGAEALRAHVRGPAPLLGLLRLHAASRLDAAPEDVLRGAARLGPAVWLPRLLRRTADLRYEGAVHESVEAWARRHGAEAALVQADIVHLGEVPALRQARGKRARNVELLLRQCEAEPTRTVPYGQLAMELLGEGRYAEAAAAVDIAWPLRSRQPPGTPVHRLATARGVLACLRREPGVALESAEACEASDGPSAESHVVRAWAFELQALSAEGDARGAHLAAAEASARAALALQGAPALDACLPGASSGLAELRLGGALLGQGRAAEAAAAFGRALAWTPDHLEACVGLAEARLVQGDAAGALALVEARLAEAPDLWALAGAAARALGSEADAQAFEARALASGKPWVTARWMLRARAAAGPTTTGAGAPAEAESRPPAVARPAEPLGAGAQRWAVTVVSPPGYSHAAAFAEVAESLVWGLRALGHDAVACTDPRLEGRRHLLLGANLLPPGARLQQGTVVYNLEQIEQGSPWLTPALLDLYRRYELWDYSEANATALERMGLPRPRVVPIGHAPVLTRIQPAAVEDLDVLFYGSVNERRKALLEALAARGVRVHVAFDVYGKDRDALIARSKIVLNVHFFEAKVFEIVRVSYLLANGRCVVSERGSDPAEEAPFEDAVAFAPREELVERCLELLARPDERRRRGERGREAMACRRIDLALRRALESGTQGELPAPPPPAAPVPRVAAVSSTPLSSTPAPLPPPPAGEDPARRIVSCSMLPRQDGTFALELLVEEDGEVRGGRGLVPFDHPPERVPVPTTAASVPAAALVAHLAQGYDLAREERERAGERPGAPLRVAFTVLWPDRKGGGTVNLFRIVNWLTEAGVEVHVYSNNPAPTWVTVNARYHAIPDADARYAAIQEPVVVVYSVLELPQLLRHCATRGKRLYHLCQGAEDFHYGSTPPGDLMRRGLPFELYNRLPVGRLVVSRHLADYYARKYGQRALLMENGVDLEVFSPGPRAGAPAQRTVLTVGDPGHALKGAGLVRKALAEVARRHPDWSLHLVNVCGTAPEDGGPPPTTGFTSELRLGLDAAAMAEAFRAADVYVNASWYEGFGLPSLEAMACGTPVVQADNHGLDQIVEDGRDCLLVPPGDAAALADALERVLEDAPLRERLAAAGRVTAARHGLERQRAGVLEAFGALLGAPLAERAPVVAGPGDAAPRFSVLVPCYNQAHFLGAALESLLAQTEPSWEALVVDDGSTDATPAVIERYARRDARIRGFRQQNGGVAAALNRGLGEARAPWICWLSSDDLFAPGKLALHRDAARADAGLRFMHTNYAVLHERTGQLGPSGLQVGVYVPSRELQTLGFLRINYVNGISVAVHRAVFEQVGQFDLRFRYGQDYDVWLRASARFRSTFIDQVTCVTRLHPQQGTALFSEAGIYDSARAALEFLDRSPLQALFPCLDLAQPEQAKLALVASLQVLLDPSSFITRCGFGVALLDRLREWIAWAPRETVRVLQGVLRQSAATARDPALRAMLEELAGVRPEGYRYPGHDAVALLERHAARLERSGAVAERAALKRYQKLLADSGRTGLEERT